MKCPGIKCPGTFCLWNQVPGDQVSGTKCPGTKCPVTERKKKDTFLAPNRLFYKSCKIQSILNFGMRFSASCRSRRKESNELGFIDVKLLQMVQNRRQKWLFLESELVVYITPDGGLSPSKFLRWGFQGGATTAIAVVGYDRIYFLGIILHS